MADGNNGLSNAIKTLGMNPGEKSVRTPVLPQKEDYSDWSQLAELILEAEIKDEIASGIESQQALLTARAKGEESQVILPAPIDRNMRALALKIATGFDELQGIKESISPEFWQQKKLERVIRHEQIRNRLSDYAELEYIAIRRLVERVEDGKITATGELLAVANLSSKMSQFAGLKGDSMSENRNGQNPGGISLDLQINNVTGIHPNGDLPGAGHLGTIKLSLHNRIRNQLEASLPPSDEERGSFLDSIQMLSAKEVQHELLIEHESDEGEEK